MGQFTSWRVTLEILSDKLRREGGRMGQLWAGFWQGVWKWHPIVLLALHWPALRWSQDTQLLLWDLAMDEVVEPLRRMTPAAAGVSPSVSSSNQSARWDGMAHPVGALHPAPVRKEVPKLAPVMAHRVHAEPLSGLLFTKEAIVTACHEGHLKIWDRPGHGNNVPTHTPELSAIAGAKDKLLPVGKGGISHLRQWFEWFFGPLYVCVNFSLAHVWYYPHILLE